jgi:hypothetical protein
VPDTTTTTDPGHPQTISARGGVTTVSCQGNQIRLISAIPASGFTVSVGGDSRQLDVQYSSSGHQSDVRASCQAGTLHSSVNENNGD